MRKIIKTWVFVFLTMRRRRRREKIKDLELKLFLKLIDRLQDGLSTLKLISEKNPQ